MSSAAERCRGTPPRIRALVFAFVTGLAITIVEFSAVRLFAPFFGQSPLVWANVIGVVLFALAIGYVLGGRLAERHRVVRDLSRVAWLAAATIALAPFVGPRCARWLLPEGFASGPDLSAAALASFIATVAVFTLPLACLGALSPLLLRSTSGEEPIGRFAGVTMAISTLGAVTGGYATTLWLIPTLGTRHTLLACAVAIALAPLLLEPRRRTGLVCAIGIAAWFAAPELREASKGPGLPGDRVVLERDGSLQTIRVLERIERPPWLRLEEYRTRVLALDEGDAEYHSVAIEGRPDTLGRYYDLFPLLPRLLETSRDEVEVLVLGFAAGSAYRVLDHTLGDRLRMTGVEIDPLVIEVGHEVFAIPRDDPRLTIVRADARVFLRGLAPSRRFDIVIVDCYAQQQFIPFHVATVEFFRELARHLADDGVVAANLDARSSTALLPSCVANSVRAAGFATVILLPLPAFPSELLVARVSGIEPWLPRSLPDPPFFDVAFSAWSRRRAVPASLATVLLTDDHAPIERLVDHSLARTEMTR